jgi:hypothetical protein
VIAIIGGLIFGFEAYKIAWGDNGRTSPSEETSGKRGEDIGSGIPNPIIRGRSLRPWKFGKNLRE